MTCSFNYEGKCRITSTGLERCDSDNCPHYQTWKLILLGLKLQYGEEYIRELTNNEVKK